MPEKDYNKQIARRESIKRTTLVVGMDIGCEFNAMCLMNKDGEVLGKYPKIYNSRQGFNYFHKTIEEMKVRKDFKEVIIGLEPTGHYWRKIAYFAKDKDYEVRFVRTTALKHQRELDESSSAKNDIKDAITIANITREGKYIDTAIEDDIFRQLRTLSHVRERIQRYNIGSKNSFKAVLDDYFPELKGMFWAMESKGLWAVLDKCPFPEDVLKLELEEVADIIAKSTKRKTKAAEKAAKIYQAAKESIGLKKIGIADRYRLKMYLEEVKRSQGQLEDMELQMKWLLEEIPCAETLLSIPGIGSLSCAVFLGELGNPCNFRRPQQIIKYAGYDPKENDSGKKIGRKIISKKGRWLLRKCLYFMSMRAINRSAFFKEYYQRKITNNNSFGQPLSRKEALCAVVIKLVKVIFALLRDNRTFTAEAPVSILAA